VKLIIGKSVLIGLDPKFGFTTFRISRLIFTHIFNMRIPPTAGRVYPL